MQHAVLHEARQHRGFKGRFSWKHFLELQAESFPKRDHGFHEILQIGETGFTFHDVNSSIAKGHSWNQERVQEEDDTYVGHKIEE